MPPAGDWPHLLERQLAGQFEAHHHHASDPEEQDVVARLQQSARVEHVQVLRLRVGGQKTHTQIKIKKINKSKAQEQKESKKG